MPVQPEPTPNPNALKFSVGVDVGGPATFTGDADDPLAAELLAIDGVTSVFKTADFVTLTKAPDADWDAITPVATEILEGQFG